MVPKISNHSSQSHVNYASTHFYSKLPVEGHLILTLNKSLDNLHVPYDVNEQIIENFLRTLKPYNASLEPVYWLMMTRLFELSLICAGHYADSCEFSAAGDLLVNPREILIHRKGYPHPQVKKRHGRLTEQLNAEKKCRELFLLQVKNEVIVEITKPAILPHLFERIERSCRIASWYLHDAQERMKKIADTIGFLSAWSLSGFEVLHHRSHKMSSRMRRFVSDHQCNFNSFYYRNIGLEIPRIIEYPKEYSEFLSNQNL